MIIYIVLLFLVLDFLLLVISMISTTRLKNKKQISTIEKKKETSPEIIKLMLDKDIEKCNIFVDSLIKNAIDLYFILNGINAESYLTEKEIKIINDYVFGMVKNNMTEATKDIIGLYYDISTDEKMNNFLLLRIKLNIIAVAVEQNRPI